MLNGQVPLIVFTFAPPVGGEVFNAISGIPIIGERVAQRIGVPLPIYLDERISGLYVTAESRSIDVETEVNSRADDKTPKVKQWSLNSTISVTMVGQRDSAALATLTAFCDLAFQKVVSQNYGISYFNGNLVVLNGLLHGFSSETGNEDDLVRVILQISRGKQEINKPEDVPFLDRVRGSVPS